MYAAAVQKLECAHLALAAQLDGQLKQDVPDDLATVVDRISSNAFRLDDYITLSAAVSHRFTKLCCFVSSGQGRVYYLHTNEQQYTAAVE